MKKLKYKWVEEWFDSAMNGYYEPICKKTIQWTTDEHKEVVRQLKNSDNMAPVYDEIEKKITAPGGNLPTDARRQEVLNAIVEAATLYNKKNPNKQAFKNLKELQNDIIKTANKLLELLNKHVNIQEKNDLYSEANTCPLHLLKRAGLESGDTVRVTLFEGYIKPSLDKIDGGLWMDKYLPSLQDVLEILKNEMELQGDGKEKIIYSQPVGNVINASRKTGWPDFVRGLYHQIDKSNLIPRNFRLKHENMVAIVNVLFNTGIDTDNITDARKTKR